MPRKMMPTTTPLVMVVLVLQGASDESNEGEGEFARNVLPLLLWNCRIAAAAACRDGEVHLSLDIHGAITREGVCLYCCSNDGASRERERERERR